MKSILIVDDMKSNREMLTDLFRMNGLRTHAVNSGVEAMRFLKKEKVDVLISDLEMENGDGIWLLKKLEDLPFKPYTIIFSGAAYVREEFLQRLGADVFLPKPSPIERIISSALEG